MAELQPRASNINIPHAITIPENLTSIAHPIRLSMRANDVVSARNVKAAFLALEAMEFITRTIGERMGLGANADRQMFRIDPDRAARTGKLTDRRVGDGARRRGWPKRRGASHAG